MANVKEIKFDTSELNKCAQKVTRLKGELNEAKNKIIDAMDQVKDGWQGKGADKFESLIDKDWAEHLERYCELMDVLVSLIKEASQTYDRMEDQIESLKYKD